MVREIIIRKLIFLSRNNRDEQAKQRLMPIVRDLIQAVVIGHTRGTSRRACRSMFGHQHHGVDRCAGAAVFDCRTERPDGELPVAVSTSEPQRKKLLDAYAEELLRRYPKWGGLPVLFGCGGRI
ncbi:MAG: hypothetical protein ACK4P4_24185 [Allorhizobium sp.]